MRPDLIVRRDLLAGRVLNRIGPGGLIHAPGTSRVLESALLLALLTNEDLLPEQAELTRRYLKNTLAHDPPDPLQHCFAQAALGDTVAADQAVEAALSPFRHFSSERKMLTFRTLLHEVAGSTAARHRLPPDTYEVGDQQVWLSMQMCALKAMTAPEEATDADWTRLAPALRPGPAWQANHLARLIALFALRKHPAHRPAVRGTLVRIAAEQLPGGGVPFVTGLDVFATAVAGLALARVRPRDPRLTAMADALAAHQNPDGGLGFTTGVTQSDIDDTSYTLEFLRAVTPGRHGEAITRAERYLLDQQNTDGGFPSFVRGTPSEIAMTAGAVNALAPSHRRARPSAVWPSSWPQAPSRSAAGAGTPPTPPSGPRSPAARSPGTRPPRCGRRPGTPSAAAARVSPRLRRRTGAGATSPAVRVTRSAPRTPSSP
ncbi:prenyltransferase/squalene oxidase repeat-containing protein [Streptomyces clavuligerus]|uniref:prenyltransferase/squalene oxidase repeat-containing protein n=1 Tax=Streptomyces clavuligerus TaxID=1901 RepID=UPI0002EBB603|nr:prenyltransferase/squalene oxidase repeat-containing protein [Streptomyces clavuligerus]